MPESHAGHRGVLGKTLTSDLAPPGDGDGDILGIGEDMEVETDPAPVGVGGTPTPVGFDIAQEVGGRSALTGVDIANQVPSTNVTKLTVSLLIVL